MLYVRVPARETALLCERGCPSAAKAATMPQVEAQPYAFPFDGDLDPAKTAVILIDMQII